MSGRAPGRDHWSHHARQWRHVGPPLRPVAEDVALFERLVAGDRRTSLRAALLGVTPELARMRWPRGTRLVAFDRCPAMLAEVWPGTAALGRAPCFLESARAVRADWCALPAAAASLDVVVGDGCYTLLDAARGYPALGREVARALAPGGRFVMRFFVRPERPEPVDAVFADLRAGRIGSFHAFKWRLAMALHGSLAEGVAVAEIWSHWRARERDAEALAAHLGWPAAEVRTIDAYRAASARYTFPTLAEARASLAEDFVERACHIGGYELGERCPTLLMTAASDADRW